MLSIILDSLLFFVFLIRVLFFKDTHWTDYALPIVYGVIVTLECIAYWQRKILAANRAKLFDALLKKHTNDLE